MKFNSQQKIFTIIIIVVLIIGIFCFPDLSSQINLSVLSLTFLVLIFYAFDTNRIANQTIESALRPVILRQGKIIDWKVISREDMEQQEFTLEFSNQKNIAKDILGYIILENKKYKLLFGNEITEEFIEQEGNIIGKKIILFEKWGWLPVGGKLYATYEKEKFEEIKTENCLCVTYKDIEGNSYQTFENKDFSQESKRL